MREETNFDISSSKIWKKKIRWKENFLHALYKNLMDMSWEIIWIFLKKKGSIPIDIIYERTLDENKKIECFFAPDTSLAYLGYIEKIRKNIYHAVLVMLDLLFLSIIEK